MAHLLYLVRHGEQLDAEHGVEDGRLSGRGVRQAHAIAQRLSGVHFDHAWTSPLQRATETAEIMQERLPAVTFERSALLLDCIPSGLEPGTPVGFHRFLQSVRPAESEAGAAQMQDAAGQWLRPSRGDVNELLITHNFVISWFVREVMQSPSWQWMALNQANCGLTIIRRRTGKPPQLVAHNDLGHLPPEDRTGMPMPQPY
ncbi:histidine phosphatase family protein [Agrococcus beijingensis]|uniref:histidine phosphatase family protein n=1 Tax=Agrococcus beijingensis TaxID=3068634 RepID=UPI0027425291|nr:histidine phosphatase family protein [Agrococcus sp. REN33]